MGGLLFLRRVGRRPARYGDTVNAGAGLSGWDGSDLFMVWPFPRHPFASDRLASIIRQEKLSGVKLIPPAAIEIEPGAAIHAGSLFAWIPEQRADELSHKLGIC